MEGRGGGGGGEKKKEEEHSSFLLIMNDLLSGEAMAKPLMKTWPIESRIT